MTNWADEIADQLCAGGERVGQTKAVAAALRAAQARREKLPERRFSQTLKFDFGSGGSRHFVTIGYYDDGRPGELFLDSGKVGTDIKSFLRDGAIAISLALQHGCTVETLREAFSRGEMGEACTPFSAALDLIKDDEPIQIVRRLVQNPPPPEQPGAETQSPAPEGTEK